MMKHHVPRLHDRRRGRVPDRRPGDVGAAVARLGAAGRRAPRARRSDQARAPPVDRRGRHQDLRRRHRARATRSSASAASCPRAPSASGCASPPPARIRSRTGRTRSLSPGERYENIVEELQQLARSLLIFGLHIHVAVPDRASTIELLNEARYFLPHLLALSTSSPFWQGRDTGLKSYRTTVFRRFPRSGIPDQFDSWSEYEEYLDTLVELHCIDDGKKVWWDLRPHPIFGTLEFRICDVPTSPRVDGRARGARAGARRQAVPAAPQQSRLPHLLARAGRGEQVARGALRPRRQADRLRQARGSADARAGARAARVRGRRGRRAGQPEGAVRTSTPSSRKAPAPIGSWRSTRNRRPRRSSAHRR